jgi:transposase
MGTGYCEIARLLGMSRTTERQYREAIAAAGLLTGADDDLPALDVLRATVEAALGTTTAPPQQTSSLERWRPALETLFDAGLRPRAAYDRIRLLHDDFDGSYWAVKRLWRQRIKQRGVRAEDVAIPVETAAGEVAQVDFGYVGRLYDATSGRLRKTWAFVMVLGHSRHMVVRLVFDQKVETWLRLHVEAFAELGGVVGTVVPDNLKAAVVRCAFGVGGATALNRSYRELARHYGFKIDPTPPRSPQKKGKVESGVKYVKRNFMAGRDGQDVDDVRRDLVRWVAEVAGLRTHGTTGEQPLAVFETVERAALSPLPRERFEPVVWAKATVHRDSHVCFDKRLYSVPWRLIGKQVWVRATAATVAVYADDTRVATHAPRGRGVRSTCDEHLPDHRAPLRHRSREYWVGKADDLHPDVGAYVREVFDADDVLSMLRQVQAIVTELAKYPRDRAAAASRRASFYGSYSAAAVKTILRRGLDFEPLPTAVTPPASPQQTMRFARSMTELLHHNVEDTHEPN